MPERTVPLSVQERHKLLFIEKTPKEELMEWGKAHMDKGLLHDALEYYEKAGSAENLNEIRRRAIEEADLVLYQSACRSLKLDPVKEELLALREAARNSGKQSVEDQVSLLVVSKEK